MRKIVPKEWGMEIWYINEDYCGKRLIFAEDYRCSLHYHKNKHETFLVTSGRILLEYWSPNYVEEYFGKKCILEIGDTAEIEIGAWHRMTAVGGNAAMIEFSSHHEDSDSYRIESGQLWD